MLSGAAWISPGVSPFQCSFHTCLLSLKGMPDWSQTCACGLHPPNPARFFPPTRPTDCEQSISQRRALCPGEHRLYKWSFQASLLPSRNGTHVVPTASLDSPSKLATDRLRDKKADWPLTARFDEHRPKCNIKFHHACALGEHKRPTAFVIRLPACALREHRNDMRVVPSLLLCAFGEGDQQPSRAPLYFHAHLFIPGSSLDQSKRARARYVFSPRVGRWEPPASCERCAAPLLGSLFWRWRDAMSEGPFGRSRDGPSWRSQAAAAPCGFTLAEAVVTRPTSTLPRAQGLTRLIPLVWS